MAKKAQEPKFRKLNKVGKVKVGKFYKIGDHVIKADKVLRIETNQEVIEHDSNPM